MYTSKQELQMRATSFLKTCYDELGITEKLAERIADITKEIENTGTYFHTTEELTHGARMAWRNSNRCIGRIYWKTLKVIDARHLDEDEDILNALQEHIEFAFNKGNIQSTITIFRQQMPNEELGPRIVNHQLVRFAGFKEPDGSIIGDPSEVEFTQWCNEKGHSFEQKAFELLPLAIQWPNREATIKMPSVPEDIIIPIVHPEYGWFEELNLFWHGVPIISDMMLEIGGIRYTAAPFNGWYMATEIGSRNFGDINRYNLMPTVAQKIGLDTKNDKTLWKDRALVELNRAVIFSYEKAGVTLSNHHESAEQFIHFESSEERKGRPVTADWIWIIPPMSGSAMEVFHRNYDNTVLTPNFFYQEPMVGKPKQLSVPGCPFHSKSLEKQ
jgi:nitric-oxide synthase